MNLPKKLLEKLRNLFIRTRLRSDPSKQEESVSEPLSEPSLTEVEPPLEVVESPRKPVKNLKFLIFIVLAVGLLVFYLAGDLITFGMLITRQNLEVSLPLLNTRASGLLVLTVLAVLKVIVSVAILVFALAVSKQEIKDGIEGIGIPVSKLEISLLQGLELEKTALFLLATFTIYGAALTLYNLQGKLEIDALTNIEYLILLGVGWDFLEFRKGGNS